MPDLFDMKLRAMRRGRAARRGPELFLFDRVFEDCLERIQLMERRFDRALMIGCPDPSFARRLESVADEVDVRDPSPLVAEKAGGSPILEDAWEPSPQVFDLVVAIGTLDSVNDLPLALRLIAYAMKPDGLLIGALAGGETLPRLRSAMFAADALAGGASPHVHPRIEPSALAPLLAGAGFSRPVVDVDRIQLSYASLERLVADLRAMGCTNLLHSRPRPFTPAQWNAAARAFTEAGDGDRTVETVEILHFAAWAAKAGMMPR